MLGSFKLIVHCSESEELLWNVYFVQMYILNLNEMQYIIAAALHLIHLAGDLKGSIHCVISLIYIL